MTAKFFRKIVIGALFAAAIAVAAAVVVVPRMLDLDSYRAQILSAAQHSLNRRVSYDTAAFSWQFPPSIMFRGITIAEKSGDTTLLKVERLTFKLALLPLLHKEVRLREIVVERPLLTLDRSDAGLFNVHDLVTGAPSEVKIHIGSVRIRNGLVRFTDHLNDPQGLSTSLENLDLDMSGLARGETSSFKLSTMIPGQEGPASVAISGTARIPVLDVSLRDTLFDVKLSAKNVNAGRYWPYYGRYLPFERVRGQLDIEEVFTGKPTEFTTKGDLKIRNLWFSYPRVFHTTLTPRDIRIAYDVKRTPGDISLKSFDLDVDGFRAKGSFALADIPSKDPRISASVAVSPFRLEDFHQYIPYGIIPAGTANFIEKHINGGLFQVDEGRLDGRISQILQMERGDNYNVLLVRCTVDKGLMSFGPQVPILNNIKGDLEMRGKDFSLSRMTGRFGSSPFTLEGKIADYPLDKPCSYPFSISITPREAEVAWLLRQGNPPVLAFSGQSLMTLTGSGTADDYRLTGSWDLSSADYRYRQLLHKPAGKANQLRFSVRLGDSEARLENLHYELSPLDVTASATYRFNEQAPLEFALATSRFMVDPLLPSFPMLSTFHPSGRLQAEISGSGNPAESAGIKMKGTVALAGFSLCPLEQISPLTDITGTIHVTEATVESEQLTGKIGNTAFTAKGGVTGLTSPIMDLDFSSPRLHPEDFGFQADGEVPEVKNLAGSISLKGHNLAISALSGGVGSSEFMLSGEVRDIRSPIISLRADFPHLRVEDLVPLTGLKRAGSERESRDLVLKAKVTSTAGSGGDISFKNLDTEFSLAKGLLDVQAFRAGIFGGNISGNGRVDFTPPDGPDYRLDCKMANIDAESFFQALGATRDMSGILNLKADLTARGDSATALKKSLQGSLSLQMEKGVINKFGIISKVFSIINMSDLLDYRLPDLKGIGMPYNRFDGNVTFKDGIVTTNDLSVRSPSLNIKFAGSADIVNREVDLKIGVQPFQIVGKVVSRIPVIGWILTGKNKRFVVFDYEAKGKWDDPTVTALPMESLTNGVYRIFRRIFTLPENLISDPGKVILGK